MPGIPLFIENYNKLKHYLRGDKGSVICFIGSPTQTTPSWSADCIKFQRELLSICRELEDDIVVPIVFVGTKQMWADKNNSFRKDERFKLTSIPTILNIKTGQKLEGRSANKPENVKYLLSNATNT